MGAILKGSKTAVGVVFTGTGQDFYFYYGPRLGRDRIFSVGVGWDGNQNPLPWHFLMSTH